MIRQITSDSRMTLVIDRPHRKNAFNGETVSLLLSTLRAAELDKQLRVVVIKGAGDTFCAGRDLKEATTTPLAEALTIQDEWSEVFSVLHRLRCPSVAVVRGYAVAGGFTLAMGCDFVLAERQSQFGALEMQNGFPAAVCTPILASKTTPRVGLELALFGELVTAVRLYEVGLINRLADGGQALEALEQAFVGRIESLDPVAVRQTVESFRAARGMPLADAMTLGRHLNQLLDATGKFVSGGQAFSKS